MRRYACLIPLAASFSRSKDSSLMMCSILQALASATSGSTPAAISCSVKNKGEILIHLERSMIELWILSSFSGAVNAVASSKITMGASFRMQRTIEMRCFSPPERVAPPCQPLFNHILMDRHTAEGRKSSCQHAGNIQTTLECGVGGSPCSGCGVLTHTKGGSICEQELLMQTGGRQFIAASTTASST